MDLRGLCIVVLLAVTPDGIASLKTIDRSPPMLEVVEGEVLEIFATLDTDSNLYWIAPPCRKRIQGTLGLATAQREDKKTTLRIERVSRYQSGVYQLGARGFDEHTSFSWTVTVKVKPKMHVSTKKQPDLNVGALDSAETSLELISQNDADVIWKFTGCIVVIAKGDQVIHSYDQCEKVEKMELDLEMRSRFVDSRTEPAVLYAMLLLQKVPITYEDKDTGKTVLHAAAERGDPEVALLLLECGAKVGATTRNNSRAVDFAKTKGMRTLLESWVDETDDYGRRGVFYFGKRGEGLGGGKKFLTD